MEEKKRLNLGSLFIMIGLITIGISIYQAAVTFKSYDRTVQVKGLCEKEVGADRVIWPLSYKIIGNDLISLYDKINKNNSIVIDFLKANGIGDAEISISAPQVVDIQADRYADQNRIGARFNITSVITVNSQSVDKIREVIAKQTELLKKDISLNTDDYRYPVKYFFDGLNNIKPQMVEEATQNARATAEKFASDSKSKLGKIKNASQGLFTVTDRDETVPYIKNVRVVTNVEYFLR